ncbi:ribonuclease R [Ruminiclostridium papyrosolvens DSM 2782]|uniref:Ribonuclease R n=1 Tax=Ruminiclostridium papyrosolvens DSM 2782 TaxID=588581 RepID=F1T8G1_9FIRM|nr:ribonuclease R [Ruminiclostridium papyrosolvens]EGD49759.1 ribonuclease R [Ruminiclostridium papyrosolvens DSM 2782]WES33114.1 ribonuclease R [Ruminiclostridium papyrosolvens DSM 2782]
MADLEERKERIVAFMRDKAYKPLLFKELLMVLDVPEKDIELFTQVIDELEEEGRIFKTHGKRYGVPTRLNLVTGRIQGHERGYGFLIPDDELMEDVFIPADSLNGAMHNDRVVARVNKKSSTDRRMEGEIIRILKRANTTLVGTFENSMSFGFVVPDNKRISGDIFVSKSEFQGAKKGQKVVVEILKYPEARRNAEGRIIEIIGDRNETGVDILSIIKSYNLEEDFPEDVLNQANSVSETVTEEMIQGRRDLRGLRMVTIDGEDAKDLDDAVSIEILENGNYRLGVHIADVTNYVTENSPLDIEALDRGTSVYLVDRVIPMLPRKLSNGICSLNPHVDRLSFTVIMDIDKNGRVYNHEIFESVINIDERMTYTNVYKILADNDQELIKRYSHVAPDFYKMQELALILRKKRFQRGAIDFDFDEAKVVLDEKGRPIDVKRYEITIANQIIEEFMLACNETVAEHFFWTNTPFVYRVHEDPDEEKIHNLNEFLYNLGYSIKGINKIHPRALQDLLEKVKGTRHERIISTVMLRSLQKARYSNESTGHFGLAAKYYCHFTSPIRRYPDLIIHRIMKLYLKGGMSEEKIRQLEGILPEIAKQCSERERGADEAERESEDLKKVEYMKAHEGEIFEGIIANVTSFGMFIELDNTIEGLVRMSSMEDDYYNYDEAHYCLVGERTRKIYRIGDTVKVILAKADISARKIEFILVESDDDFDSIDEETEDEIIFTKRKKEPSAVKRTSRSTKPDKDKADDKGRRSTSSGNKPGKKGKIIDKKVYEKIMGKRKRKKR